MVVYGSNLVKGLLPTSLNINYNPKQTIVNVDLCFIFSVFLTEGGERSRDTKLKQHFRRLLLKTKS